MPGKTTCPTTHLSIPADCPTPVALASALLALTKSAAKALAGRNICVNAVAWPDRQRRNDTGTRAFADEIRKDCGREDSNLHVPKDTGT